MGLASDDCLPIRLLTAFRTLAWPCFCMLFLSPVRNNVDALLVLIGTVEGKASLSRLCSGTLYSLCMTQILGVGATELLVTA